MFPISSYTKKGNFGRKSQGNLLIYIMLFLFYPFGLSNDSNKAMHKKNKNKD
jgi:hypothetical protein